MATLSNATYDILLPTNQPGEVIVSATVNVGLNPLDKFLIAGGLGLELISTLRAEDGGLNATYEDLLNFVSQQFTAGIYISQAMAGLSLTVSQDQALLNESLFSKNSSSPLQLVP